MRIVQITPGAGADFYCGNCVRDNPIVRAWRRLGHEATLVPLYLPLPAGFADAARDQPVFFGGVNVYLQQKWGLFRRTPRWLDRLFDAPALLRWASRRSGMTSPQDLGQATISMLQGEQGRQVKELRRLTDWLSRRERPDVVCLSNALLAGLAGPIRRRLGVPVACLLEGEDEFLDGLPAGSREGAWDMLRRRCADIDAFLAVSRYYADLMSERLALPAGRVQVVRMGIDPEGYAPADSPPQPPTVGYLSRLCPQRGLDLLVEAFIRLKGYADLEQVHLRAAGGWLGEHGLFIAGLRQRLAECDLAADVEFLPNLDRTGRQAFLRSLSVLSVPSRHPEPFGMFVLEALASGVPVAMPECGGFPETLQATGGGVLFRPGDVGALAEALASLLRDCGRAEALGRQGRQAVLEGFTADSAAAGLARVFQSLVR